ncbi:MAG: TonB-dependent receptor [Gammaproteobacteria bacterium]|nr:MAG: TonB-dependent receptor [Gammaproteobacteria bacterium]
MINKNEKLFQKNKLSSYIKIASSLSLFFGVISAPTHAANERLAEAEEIVVTGQRASIQSAQDIKKNASSIVDSIVADDMGKLPDRSVTEALQRVPGITVTHFDTLGDPEHFSAEGSGIAVRGLTQVRSELNGRDIFTASSGGRALSFEDVPAELMAGVDVIKSPTADLTEGGLGGIVNLRTRMPFDTPGQQIALTAKASYAQSVDNVKPSYSGLYTNQWDTDMGRLGLLVDISTGETNTRTDGVYTREWYTRADLISGKSVYLPRGVDWRRVDFSRDRTGSYAALQWAPNDDLELYLTAFRTEYTLRWDENAAFLSMSSEDVKNLNAYGDSSLNFDADGSFVSGKITTLFPNNASNGIAFGVDTRASNRDSDTTDLSTGFKWSPDEYWEFNGDFQLVKANSVGLDNTIALGVEPAYVDINLSGHLPSISVPDNALLVDPSQYYWTFTMPHVVNNEAEEKAIKLDAKYSFENSIIKSVKVGARFTNRTADNEESDYHWRAMTETWGRGSSWQPHPNGYKFPSIINPQDVSVFKFTNFYRGDANVPTSVLVPNLELIDIYPSGITDLRKRAGFVNADAIPDMTLPQWHNNQEEKSSAIYVSTTFGFDDLSAPVDGNFGVRIVTTQNTATGFLVYPSDSISYVDENGDTKTATNPLAHPSEIIDAENKYTNILPNFNIRVKLDENLFLRFSAAKAISRPEFSSLAANLNLTAKPKSGSSNQSDALDITNLLLTVSSDTNPYLKPMISNQFDASIEWYFDDHGGEVHANLFRKEVDDYIAKSTSSAEFTGYTFITNWPINSGHAEINGLELGWSQFFDALPAPFDGLGISANYTYINSKAHFPVSTSAIDTDASTYADLPYAGISKNSYNLVGMYEKNNWSLRLAYNWRSEYLMSVGANGYNGYNEANGVNWRLPVYADDFGQLDGSIGYKFNENIGLQLSVSNITNAETKTIIKQKGAGNHYAAYFVNDTRYELSLSAKF